MKTLTAIDLCCGAGGWITAARGLPIRFKLAMDWAEDCCQTVRYNHPDVPVVCGDVTRLDWERLRGVDLVLGAIPCEEISVARCNRTASEETMRRWHALLDGMLVGIETVHPRWWAVENVIQMRQHLPPLVPQVVLDSAGWSAQKRRRLFLGRFRLPQTAAFHHALREHLRLGPHIVSAKIIQSKHKSHRQWYAAGTKRVLNPNQPAPTITDFGSRHSRGFVVEEYGKERVLTLQESASLQGFPSDYIFVTSLSRAFKMSAQAVQVDLARAILQSICTEAFGTLNGRAA